MDDQESLPIDSSQGQLCLPGGGKTPTCLTSPAPCFRDYITGQSSPGFRDFLFLPIGWNFYTRHSRPRTGTPITLTSAHIWGGRFHSQINKSWTENFCSWALPCSERSRLLSLNPALERWLQDSSQQEMFHCQNREV